MFPSACSCVGFVARSFLPCAVAVACSAISASIDWFVFVMGSVVVRSFWFVGLWFVCRALRFGVGVLLAYNIVCLEIALSWRELHHFPLLCMNYMSVRLCVGRSASVFFSDCNSSASPCLLSAR